MTDIQRGEFRDVVVRSGETKYVQGAVDGLTVEPQGGITVQGAIVGAVMVDGSLIAQGSLTSRIRIGPTGVVAIQGVAVGCSIENAGTLALDCAEGYAPSVKNTGHGQTGQIDDLPPGVRKQLGTVSISYDK